MARPGTFGEDQTPRGWFDSDARPLGWFDDDFLSVEAVASTVSAASGSYAMVGFAVALKKTSLVLAASGSFALSGGTGGGAAWDKGWNFRATSGYATDGTDETYSLGGAYPETRNGVTFGWTVGPTSTRDRDNTNDRRLAGVNQQSNDGTQSIFRVDLPAAGEYLISLALGDAGFSQGYQYLQILDGASVLLTIDDTNGTAQNGFDDATGTEYTNAAWPGSNSPVALTFAGTTLTVKIGPLSAPTQSSTLAHLFVSKVDTGTAWTNLKVGRKVQGGAGSFALSGQTATLTYDAGAAVMVAAPGTYTETGIAAVLRAQHNLALANGTYTETGIAAGLKSGRRVSAGQGTYNEIGVAAGLRTGRQIALVKGTYTETGIAARLAAQRKLLIGTGSYTETGNAANLVRGGNVILISSSGTFAQSGQAATLRAERYVQSLVGTYTETGRAAGLAYGHRLLGNVGTFALTGQTVELTFRGSAGTSAFTGELTVSPRFTGSVLTAARFVGEPATFSLFTGVVLITPRFSGELGIDTSFDGDLDVGPE